MKTDFDKKEFNKWFEQTCEKAKSEYLITLGSPAEKKLFQEYFMRELNSDESILIFLYGEENKKK